jgi:N-acetylmuramoyl-L-alanine amidase
MKVYIDAGHRNNSSDCGATSAGRKESADALVLAQLIACNLTVLGAQVKLSRTSENTSKSLSTRTSEANSWGADIYLSVHRNASASHLGYGAETLLYSNAEKNNAVGRKLQAALVVAGGLRDRGLKYRPDLHVLRATKMVAALIEVGFIDYAQDNAKFDANKNDLAVAIAKALIPSR